MTLSFTPIYLSSHPEVPDLPDRRDADPEHERFFPEPEAKRTLEAGAAPNFPGPQH